VPLTNTTGIQVSVEYMQRVPLSLAGAAIAQALSQRVMRGTMFSEQETGAADAIAAPQRALACRVAAVLYSSAAIRFRSDRLMGRANR